MSGAIALSIAVREIIARAEGNQSDGVDTDATVRKMFANTGFEFSDELQNISINDEFDKFLFDMLDYFEISDSIAMVQAARRARQAVAVDPTAAIQSGNIVLSGVMIIGILFAARVASIKMGGFNIEFYKGVPKEVRTLVDFAIPKINDVLKETTQAADEQSK